MINLGVLMLKWHFQGDRFIFINLIKDLELGHIKTHLNKTIQTKLELKVVS